MIVLCVKGWVGECMVLCVQCRHYLWLFDVMLLDEMSPVLLLFRIDGLSVCVFVCSFV